MMFEAAPRPNGKGRQSAAHRLFVFEAKRRSSAHVQDARLSQPQTSRGASTPARCRRTFTPTREVKPSSRIGRAPKLAPETWTVTDDWPDPLPAMQAEIDLFEAWSAMSSMNCSGRTNEVTRRCLP